MSEGSRSAGRTSHRAGLDRPRVVAAAVELADRAGLAGASMRALATALGVEPMSLYNHVANREDLLDGMVDAVFAEIRRSGGSSPWRTELRERAVATRAALQRHPWAIGLMDSRSASGPSTLAHHDAVLGLLLGAGFTTAMSIHAVSVVDSYVYGYLLQERSLPLSDTKGPRDMAAEFGLTLAATHYPNIAKVAAAHAVDAAGTESPLDAEFSFGLELILNALEPDPNDEVEPWVTQ